MPTYEYHCKKCDTDFEKEQGMDDPRVKTCPTCKSRRVDKLVSKTSFSLKGGGWASEGYASTFKANADYESHRKTFEQETGNPVPKKGES
jgi:putative FmdB family regulatory protein